MQAKRPDWAGRVVVCIASGPSLTPEDVALVRAAGHPTIVTNATFRLAPWADVLFGFDARFWRKYIDEVRPVFGGRLVCMSQTVANLGIETTYGSDWFRGMGNSGCGAIAFALGGKPRRVVLLGFDCQFGADGRKHWHGDHDHGLSNCASISKWPAQFKSMAHLARRLGVPVVNSSRRTALTCFERMDLEDALR